MNARERLHQALSHSQPGHVPFDLGSTQVTGIHVAAYDRLHRALGLPSGEAQLCDSIQQLAPGGGYVFGPVHNIQADVPSENVPAMVEALHEHGVYQC
jgi:hypothetical protein